MQRIKIIISLLVTLFFVSCLNTSDPKEINEAEINGILDEIVLQYNSYQYNGLDSILEFYSEDFVHNGMDKADVRHIWEFERLSEYNTVLISDVYIDFTDTALNAVASFTLTLSNGEEEVVYSEPNDSGESSHFSYLSGEWIIVGNRMEE